MGNLPSNKLEEYQKTLEENDGDEEEIKQEVKHEIKKQKKSKKDYQNLEQQLKESGQSQISTSDPDSRHLITRNNITEVAYTAQTIVDSDNNIPIDYKITNSNSLSRFTGNKKAMGNMLRRTKSILRHNSFTALFDKGYHTGSELAIVEHPYGTIKRQWGFNYIITKKYFERAEADFGLIMTAYNLRRIFNIVGIKKLMEYLYCSLYALKLKFAKLGAKSSFFNQSIIKLKNYNYFATTA